MNAFAWSGLLGGIACMAMAGLVYFSRHANRANRLWAIFCVAVSWWCFGALLIGLSQEAELAAFWWRSAHVGVIFIPVLFYHFVTAFADIKRRAVLGIVYALTGGFLMLDATPLFIHGTRYAFNQLHYNASGPTYPLFVAFFISLIVLGHLELWRSTKQVMAPAKRLLTLWLWAGTIIGFSGGALAFLPAFGIDLYPYGNFAVPLFPLIMTYAFLRHRIINVNVALVRGATFIAVYGLMVGIPFYIGYEYQALWRATLGEQWWLGPVALMGLLASVCPVLFLFFVRRLEQKLWKAQRRYHRTLIAASSGMTRIKDLKQLCRLIVYVVNRTVGLVSTSLYLLDGKLEQYTLAAARSNRGAFTESPTPRTHPVVDVLRQEHDLLVLQELRDLLSSSKAGDASVTQLSEAVAWMHERGVELIVPSFTEGTLLAFLALGPKRNHEPYTMDDVAMFSGLANQAALGIENAMFFEARKTSEAYMIQSEKLASLGQLASGMAHEIHNPLTIISGEAQLYLERHKGKDAEVDKVLRSIIEECHRAADITRRILRFAKPSPSEFHPVDLRATVEEAFQLIAYQVRLDRVERTVEAPSDLPKISGNQNQLQEVFLNLIVNACQAMGETGGALNVRLAHANGCVEAKVTDNGPGISPGRLTKIFDPFFTTKSTGTGLGLFVAQRIIHAHNGSIDVESTEGKGTTFTIRLPVLEDSPAS